MGKGSRQRPTDKDAFDSAFDRIFGGKNRVQYKAGNQESAPGRRQGTEAGSVQSPNQPCSSVPNQE